MMEKVAVRVITKYLKKGNMARCLRDILPSAGLTKEQREKISEIVHDVVRWKKLYEYILDSRGLEYTAQAFVTLAMDGAQADAHSYPFEFRYSCSPYVADVLKDHGELAEFLNETPPTALCVNFNKTNTAEVMQMLHEEHIPAERSILETAILTTSVSKYSKVIHQRFAHVQDENSQLIATLAAMLGESILDYCAGNGGKSLAMASCSKNTKNLHAYEVNSNKRTTLQQRCSEYNATVLVEEKPPKTLFDVVLVDAPCTGLGAARRNPEAKYTKGSGDFPTTQLSILNEAARNVRTDGVLLYAVCTITLEETAQVINAFQQKNNYKVYPLDVGPHKEYLQKTNAGVFTLLPRGDLFFISALKKT
jgi:16S rRNA (cytosine967-C5)-methyltransferase